MEQLEWRGWQQGVDRNVIELKQDCQYPSLLSFVFGHIPSMMHFRATIQN